MSDKVIHVLSIEDNPANALLIETLLAEATRLGWDLPRFDMEHVDNVGDGLKRIKEGGIDVILSDLDLPDSQAGQTVATLREHLPHMPIVVLTGREDAELARASVRAGVQDYLFKNEATGSLLAHALIYAIERQENAQALQKAHAELEQRVEARTRELRRANAELKAEIAARKQVEDALKRRLRQVTALSKASQVVTASLDLDQVLSEIIILADDVLGVEHTGVVLVDEAGCIGQTVENLSDTSAPRYQIRDKGFTHWIVRTRRSIIVDEVEEDGTIRLDIGAGVPQSVNPYNVEVGVRSFAGLPLMVKDRLLGVLYVHSTRPCAFQGQEALMKAFANQVAIAIENARLYGEAQREIAERKGIGNALEERVKELTCLYAVGRDMQEDLSVDALCQRAVGHLVPAMQFPEITVPVIALSPDKQFTTENYTEGLSHSLHAEIGVPDKIYGHLWVYYTEERPFLIPEEQNLINSVAKALSIWLERRRVEQALRESEARYRALVEGRFPLSNDLERGPGGEVDFPRRVHERSSPSRNENSRRGFGQETFANDF